MRVRVDASKNRLTIVAPRSVGTFLIARSLISLNGSAVSRISWICSPVSGSSPSRSLPSGAGHVAGLRRRTMHDGVAAVEFVDQHVDAPAGRRRRASSRRHRRWIGSSRPPRSISTASAMRAGPPEVGQLVERRANRAARCTARRRRSRRACRRCPTECRSGPTTGRGPDRLQVVAVERDVERALRDRRRARVRRSSIRFAPRAELRGAECRR